MMTCPGLPSEQALHPRNRKDPRSGPRGFHGGRPVDGPDGRFEIHQGPASPSGRAQWHAAVREEPEVGPCPTKMTSERTNERRDEGLTPIES
jgi:hypothetical protein